MSGRPRIFRGIGASGGVAIGRVFLLDRRQVRVPRYHVEPDQVDYEIERLKGAIETSVEQLEAIRSRFVGGGLDHHAVLEAHEMMVRDPALLEESAGLIRKELVNAEWACARVVSRLRSLFDHVADEYIRERRGDMDFVAERILKNLTGQVTDLDMANLDDGTVVVARDLSPADTAVLARQRVTAFVTEVGGKTSHTSIVARSLDIPAVVGVHGIFDAAGSGDLVVVDGIDGVVMLRPSRWQLDRGRKRSERFQRMTLDLLEAKALPARTLDGHDVTVAGNIEIPGEVATVLNRGGEAIGLYRTEFLFVGRSEPPGEEEHYRAYCRVFDEMGDRLVTIRTFDLGGDKVFPAVHQEQESNPALGLRAIRFCLQHPAIFEPQLAGLLRAGSRGNLRIMLPMISGVDELLAAREVIEKVRSRLQASGKEHRGDVPVGIMIEVPSAVVTIDHLARHADFFSIGTNDLLQYLLAVDRTNDRVDYLYHPLHPAVLRTLLTISQAAEEADTPVSMCGEMAGDTEHIPILLGFGLEQLSMNAGAIPKIKRLIRELEVTECKSLLQDALECSSYKDVEELVAQFMRAKAVPSMEWEITDDELGGDGP